MQILLSGPLYLEVKCVYVCERARVFFVCVCSLCVCVHCVCSLCVFFVCVLCVCSLCVFFVCVLCVCSLCALYMFYASRPSLSLSVSLCISQYLSLFLSFRLSPSPFVSLRLPPPFPPLFLCLFLSLCLSVSLSLCLPVCVSVYISYLCIYLSTVILSRDHIKIDAGVLRIVNARLIDKGMYVCMARNMHGTITTQSFVNVAGKMLLHLTCEYNSVTSCFDFVLFILFFDGCLNFYIIFLYTI